MKKTRTLSLAVGAAFAATALSSVAFAAGNPFAMQKLDAGYQLAAADADKKMDGKCGDKMKAADEKMKDGKCGDMKKAATAKMKDGKCGEGKCGAKMKMHDGKCGADKKMEAPKVEEKK